MGYIATMETKFPCTNCNRRKELEKIAELAAEVHD